MEYEKFLKRQEEVGKQGIDGKKLPVMQFMGGSIERAHGDPRAALGQQANLDSQKPNGPRTPADISV